jgi:NAD(P)-dependent dehydrogenase (short-subunit alcohol dehydrogenase family)
VQERKYCFDMTGRAAVVTGGGTGLGYEMARALAEGGARVVLAARRLEVLEKAAEQLRRETGAQIDCGSLDLSKPDEVDDWAQTIVSQTGGVDILVGNSAHEEDTKVDDITEPKAVQTLQINLIANMQLVRAFLPAMRKKKWGRIIFSSSVGAIRASAQTGMSIYAASKAGLNGFVRVAAAEVGRDGITVNALNLGMYHTEMLDRIILDKMRQDSGEEAVKAFISGASANNALGRFGQCHEVGGIVRLLASNEGGYITGQDIAVDGGLSTLMRPNPVV